MNTERRPVFGIDPSSTCTGYAVLSDPKTIVDAGRLIPDNASEDAEGRSMAMCDELTRLLSRYCPGVIVLETASRAGGRHGNESGARLQSLGIAIGAVYRTCYDWQSIQTKPLRLWHVRPEVWTQRVKKQIRATRIGMEFPAYRDMMGLDKGGDVADAIGVALWYFKQERLKECSQ